MRKFNGVLMGAIMGIALFPAVAQARDVQVKMLNSGAGGAMVFEPAFVSIKLNDTVTFVPVDKGHNAESIPTMVPVGAPAFKGAISQPITVKFAKPGLYGYKCLPHSPMGMVGLVQVGPASNKAQLQAEAARLPALAKKRMTDLLAQAR